MDRNYIGMVVAVMFLLIIITITVRVQVSAIENSAEFSRDTMAQTTRSAATVLHVRESGRNQEFGKIEQDELEDLRYNCGSSSGLAALDEDVKLAQEFTLRVCADSPLVYEYWREHGLLAGIVVIEEDDEKSDWVVVA